MLVRHDLVVRALDQTRMLHALLPMPEVTGLLALIVLTVARQATRSGADGRLPLLEEQDSTRWDREAIDEGLALVQVALLAGVLGRYALQAAIAAVHARVDSLRRLGRTVDARAAYEQALQLTANEVEREFLLRRLEQLSE